MNKLATVKWAFADILSATHVARGNPQNLQRGLFRLKCKPPRFPGAATKDIGA